MSELKPGFGARLSLAFKVLFDAECAQRLQRAAAGETPPPPAPAPAAAPFLQRAAPDAALQLLGLLQRDGRFIDFLEEEVTQYTDAQVGAAARVVHEGCRKALREHVVLHPVRTEQEGARITLAPGFDAGAIRLTGNVSGQPPFTGTLVHRGWRVAEVKLPQLSATHDTRILAPAEVEL